MNRDNHDQQMLKALQQVASNTRKIADNMEQNMFSSEVANLKLKEFKEKCLKAADENWTLQHIAMLERLFKAVETGAEYKCIGCTYFGRASDAPESVPEDCMWQPTEFEDYRPCEDD